jgi:integrase
LVKSSPTGVGLVSKSTIQWSETQSDGRRDTEGIGQRRNREDRTRQSKDAFEGLSNSQEKWRVEKDSRLYTAKCLLQGYKVQNGRCKNGGANFKTRHVVNQFGYKVGLPSYQRKPGIKRLFMFQLRRSVLPIRGNALWSKDGPKGVFKDNAQVHSGSTPSVAGRGGAIYRRHMDWSYGQAILGKIRRRNSGIPEEARLVNKCREVRTDTSKGVSFSRLGLEFRKFNSEVREGEGMQPETVGNTMVSVCKEGEDSTHQDISVSNRQIVCDKITVPGSESLFIRDEPFEDTGCQEGNMEWSSTVEGDNTEGLRMVERKLEKESSQVINTPSGRSRAMDGCLPYGMGSSHEVGKSSWSGGGINDSRILDQQLEFQSSGVGGSETGNPVLSFTASDKDDSPVVDSHRQLHDSLQYKQKSIGPQPSVTNERSVQLHISMVNDDTSCTCERFGERKSGQFIKNEQIGRLYDSPRGASEGVKDVGCSNILGSICIEQEPSTRKVLHVIEQGQEMSDERCIQHKLVWKGDSVDTSPFTSPIEMSTEGKRGEDKSSSSCSTLARSGMDTDIDSNDTEEGSDGGVEVIIAPRKLNEKEPGQVTSRSTSGVFSGRRNNEGQQMVLTLLKARGLLEFADWFFRSVAESTWRNYRRGFTLFSAVLKRSNIDPLSISTVDRAVAALIRALKVASEIRTRLSTILLMKTAVVRLFSFMFNQDLSHMPMVRMALKCLTLNEMPRKEMLRLRWSVDQLLRYLRELPSFEAMEFNQLTAVTVVLCMAFTALRFSEIYSLDIQETLPDRGKREWKFWVHVKGHDFKEPVVLHGVDESHLDPLSALWILRSAVYAFSALKKEKPVGFWYRLVDKEYIPLTYDGMRLAAARVLQQAGIEENRPYHIKHAVLTCLHESGCSAKDIAAFARHRFESMAAYHHYISYDGGKMSVRNIVDSVK